MLTGWIVRFDARADAALGHMRGNPLADGLATAASALGDHGLLWLLIAIVRGRNPRRRAIAARAVAITGIIAPTVNMSLKVAVNRHRPPRIATSPSLVRVPRTSSFPSGHALAAWCAATLLADDDPGWPLYYAAALAVAWSRVHLRLHHTSDVVAGSLLGAAIGRLARRIA